MEEGAEETVSGSGEDGANVDAGEAAPLRAEEERECPQGKQKNPGKGAKWVTPEKALETMRALKKNARALLVMTAPLGLHSHLAFHFFGKLNWVRTISSLRAAKWCHFHLILRCCDIYTYTGIRVYGYIYGDIRIYTGIQESHIRFWPTLHICAI